MTFDNKKHPRITIEDENGKINFDDLFLRLSNPVFNPAAIQVFTTAAAAITPTTPATAVFMGTTMFPVKMLVVHNSLDNPAVITINGVDAFRVGKVGEVIDLAAARLVIGPTATFGCYKTGSTPTAGELSITVLG